MSGKTILLVEDDEEIRDIVQDTLEDHGYDVVPAGNGLQALDYLQKVADSNRPAAVILDLMMPLVTGWQVLARMRETPGLSDVPVVVLTAVEKDRPQGVEVLRKPFSMQALVAAIENFMAPAAAN